MKLFKTLSYLNLAFAAIVWLMGQVPEAMFLILVAIYFELSALTEKE